LHCIPSRCNPQNTNLKTVALGDRLLLHQT
jgi:hypothetical protein